VHHYDFLPIELVCYLITGTSGGDDDVTHAYSDASWKIRHKTYDTMTPEDIRAAARAARSGNELHAFDDIECSAFAIVASEGSAAYSRMHATLQSACDRARKRKLAALENDAPDQEPQAPPDDTFVDADTHLDVQSGNDDDFLAALGV
jgi:hypothetical protein